MSLYGWGHGEGLKVGKVKADKDNEVCFPQRMKLPAHAGNCLEIACDAGIFAIRCENGCYSWKAGDTTYTAHTKELPAAPEKVAVGSKAVFFLCSGRVWSCSVHGQASIDATIAASVDGPVEDIDVCQTQVLVIDSERKMHRFIGHSPSIGLTTSVGKPPVQTSQNSTATASTVISSAATKATARDSTQRSDSAACEPKTVFLANVKSCSAGSTSDGCAILFDGRIVRWTSSGKRFTHRLDHNGKEQLGEQSVTPESVFCTRGQPKPNRPRGKHEPGQEGPRIHVIGSNGRLYIYGTGHKGLCADHFSKVLYSKRDCVGERAFYCVGDLAQDKDTCRTGAATQLHDNPRAAYQQLGMRPPSLASTETENEHVAPFGKSKHTRYLDAVELVQSTPAHIHSLALAKDGRVFAWGCGSDGRLGVDFYFSPNGTKRRLKCYVSSPSEVHSTAWHKDGVAASAIAVGRYWSFAICQQNE